MVFLNHCSVGLRNGTSSNYFGFFIGTHKILFSVVKLTQKTYIAVCLILAVCRVRATSNSVLVPMSSSLLFLSRQMTHFDKLLTIDTKAESGKGLQLYIERFHRRRCQLALSKSRQIRRKLNTNALFRSFSFSSYHSLISLSSQLYAVLFHDKITLKQCPTASWAHFIVYFIVLKIMLLLNFPCGIVAHSICRSTFLQVVK